MSLVARKSTRLEDPGAELLDRVTGLWNRWGRVALAVGGVALVAIAVVFFSVRARAQQEEQAAGRLAEADLMFWQGDYTRALQVARQISDQFGSTRSGNDAHRVAGDASFWTGDFKTAIAEYRKYLERDKRGLLADAIRRSLAYALESNGQYAQAAPIYESLVGVFGRESSAEFLMSAARCYERLGQSAEAARRLQRLIDDFGETSPVLDAREELAVIRITAH